MAKPKGRPKVKEAKQQYTVMLKPSLVKEIDEMAEKLELTRSQFMANMIGVGLDEAKAMDGLGLFKLVMAGGKAASKIKKAFYNGNLGFLNGEKDK